MKTLKLFKLSFLTLSGTLRVTVEKWDTINEYSIQTQRHENVQQGYCSISVESDVSYIEGTHDTYVRNTILCLF